MSFHSNDTGLTAIRITGGILSSSILTSIRHYQLPGQDGQEYGVEKGLKLNDELGRYWRIAQARWKEFLGLSKREDIDPHDLTINHWLIPLLTKVFGFNLTESDPFLIGERTFPITHVAFDNQVPLVLTGFAHPMDSGHERYGVAGRKRSPVGLLQEYLNAETSCLWGIASNGKIIRLFRDNPAITRPAFIEIDLERLFEEDLYIDFTVCWLLLHATRFAPTREGVDHCFLELWRNQGQNDGERVLGELSHGVTNALRELGTGFVIHPDNTGLRSAIQKGEVTKDQFFQELLRLVYRFIFLLTTEDREILLDPDAPVQNRLLYKEAYSISILRDRCRFKRHYDHHHDAWQQVLINFSGFAKGQPQLGQPALGGLFSKDQCPNIEKAKIANHYLYKALFKLCFFEISGSLSRVNYRDMGTEEFGSVYESLLELIPKLSVEAQWRFEFYGDEEEESSDGNDRKLTGSYYTPDSLVQELINSALVPIIEKRLADNPDDPRKALLEISVCDPACGSGHFLFSASRCLAAELARIDAGADQPGEMDFRHALREVVRNCIYGVDNNPLAVELCRTALWLEAVEPGKPLGFLDAHIQQGNALVGLLNPDLLANGIPDKAYDALTGDDRDISGELKRLNQIDIKQLDLFKSNISDLTACAGELSGMPEESIVQIEEKRQTWLTLNQSQDCRTERIKADLFTAAFFAPKTFEDKDKIPTNKDLAALQNGEIISDAMKKLIQGLSIQHHFFHWYLSFPEVFAKGGFDVLLGNPPWDVSQLIETEYFTSRIPAIAKLKGEKRKQAIESLQENSNIIWLQYQRDKHKVEAANQFFRNSNRFPLTAVGKLNLYALFSELAINLINEKGRAGILVPTGIATDDSTKYYFANITHQKKLASLYDFENREGLFPTVHKSYKYCLLSVGNNEKIADLSFFALQTTDLKDQRRKFCLTGDEFNLINPNTQNCPIFRSQMDAELTKKVYKKIPVLIKEAKEGSPEINPWGIKFSQGLFNMTSDSRLFKSYSELKGLGAKEKGSVFETAERIYLPLFEAKMVHHFDHRWATYETDGSTSRDCTPMEKADADYDNLPRYWVDSWQITLRTAHAPGKVIAAAKNENPELLIEELAIWAAGYALIKKDRKTAQVLLNEEVEMFEQDHSQKAMTAISLAEEFELSESEYRKIVSLYKEKADPWTLIRTLLTTRQPKYLLGWRDICRATDERTVISGIIPLAAVGDTFLLIFPKLSEKNKIACLLADQNSIIHDFIARQKIGGTHLKYHVKKQITTLPPEQYSRSDMNFIIPRVLELVYTSNALKPFAIDLGYHGDPFVFDLERRHQLKSELDSYYARLYGLNRDELRYVLDPADVMGEDYPSESFRVLKNKEMREFGEYRTQRLVLEAFDKLENSPFI